MKNFNSNIISVILLSCLMFACNDYNREIPTFDVAGETTLNVPREGGVYYVTATSTDVIAVQASKAWCKAEFSQDVSSDNLKITVEPNEGLKRDCEVVVAVYSLPTIKVTIAQDGEEPNVEEPVVPKITGSWLFNNSLDFTKATIGNDLVMYKGGAPSTEGFTSVAGPTDKKSAVRVARGSSFLANHGISANGDGMKVNEYTLLYDYRLPEANKWYCFLQTNLNNNDDGELFVKPTGEFGNGNLGYSTGTVPMDNQWHRLVIVCQLPNYYRFYIDGQLFHEGLSSALSVDNRYALDLAGMLLLGDDDGDDGEMDISQVTVWDLPLAESDIAALGGVNSNDYLTKGALASVWKFNNPANFGMADIGKDLLMYKDGTTTTEGFTSVAGPTDKKVAVKVARGSSFFANHGIEANGDGMKVNEYTILYDYRLPEANKWYCFLQTDANNKSDGEIFIQSSTGKLGNGNIGYSATQVPQDNQWHRLLIVCKLPDYCTFYIDGQLFYEGLASALALDNRYALDLAGILLLGDDDGDDGEMEISEVAIWRKPLTDAQAAALGTAGTSYPVVE